MAFCTKCSGVINERAVKCPHCEYDFADAMVEDDKSDFEFSLASDVLLMIASVVCAIWAIITGIGSIVGVLACLFNPSQIEDYGSELFTVLIAFSMTASQWIVIQRVSKLKK